MMDKIILELANRVDKLEAENEQLEIKVKKQKKYIDNLERDISSYKEEYNYTERIKENIIDSMLLSDNLNEAFHSILDSGEFIKFLFKYIDIDNKTELNDLLFIFIRDDTYKLNSNILNECIDLKIDLNYKRYGENIVNILTECHDHYEPKELLNLLEILKENGADIIDECNLENLNNEICFDYDSKQTTTKNYNKISKNTTELNKQLEYLNIYKWFMDNGVSISKRFTMTLIDNLREIENAIEEVKSDYNTTTEKSKEIKLKEIFELLTSAKSKYNEFINKLLDK